VIVWYGHHYEMYRMAHTFREMIRTRREPVPHSEILEATSRHVPRWRVGLVEAAADAKSIQEGGRWWRCPT
jgi:hypothetical protein